MENSTNQEIHLKMTVTRVSVEIGKYLIKKQLQFKLRAIRGEVVGRLLVLNCGNKNLFF